jgi:hypothetical protein
MKHRDIFKNWAQLSREQTASGNGISVPGIAAREKITVSPAVYKMNNILFFFDRSFSRILDLRDLYVIENLERGMIWPGYSTDDFFSEVSRQRNDLSWKLAQVRYILKLYAKVGWGFSPGGEISP